MFDPSKEEGTLELLPKGSYVACLINVAIQAFKSGRGQGAFFTWELVDDAYGGRRLWSNVVLVHESDKAMKFGRQKFKDIVEACGVTEAFPLEGDLSFLYGKPCLIAVSIEEDETGKFPPKNVITGVRPIPAKKAKVATTVDFNDEVPF